MEGAICNKDRILQLQSEVMPVVLTAIPDASIAPKKYDVLFRANSHLPLRVRQATAHVTPRRSAHPRFTPHSPASIVRSPPPHLCSPVLPGCAHPRSRGCRER
jgi:hypothetical protein